MVDEEHKRHDVEAELEALKKQLEAQRKQNAGAAENIAALEAKIKSLQVACTLETELFCPMMKPMPLDSNPGSLSATIVSLKITIKTHNA